MHVEFSPFELHECPSHSLPSEQHAYKSHTESQIVRQAVKVRVHSLFELNAARKPFKSVEDLKSLQAGPSWLKSIYLLPTEGNSKDPNTNMEPKQDAKLGQICKRRQNQGQSLVYVLREACCEGLENQGSAVRLLLPGRTCDGKLGSSMRVRQCDPEIEASLASYLANGLEEMLSRKRTSISQDEALLKMLEQKDVGFGTPDCGKNEHGSQRELFVGHTRETEEQDNDECDFRTRSRGKYDFESRDCMLAVLKYRLARKRLAHKTAQDLRMQAEFMKQSGQATLK